MTRRGWMILAGFPVYVIVLAFVCSFVSLLLMEPKELPGAFVDFIMHPLATVHYIIVEPEWWVYVGGPVLLIAVTQVMFLMPAVPRLRVMSAGKSVMLSIIVAGCIAGLLTTGLVLVLSSFVGAVAFGNEGMLPDDRWSQEIGFWFSPLWIIVPLVVSWPFWTVVLMRFARRFPGTTMPDRLVGVLLAGTLIEWLVILPLDIMIRRRTDCYCATGSFHGLWLAAGALIWLTGPGVMLALTAKRRRAWSITHCNNCGYAKGPSPGPHCTECGRAWATSEA